MNNFKNLLIATLTGLLALSLFTQPAQSASSANAKSIEYDHCLQISTELQQFINYDTFIKSLKGSVKECAVFRP
jgi:hypothetical protein